MRSATTEHTVEITGPGLFTGQACRAQIAPGEPGSGIVFVKNGTEIPALAENYFDQPNCSGDDEPL